MIRLFLRLSLLAVLSASCSTSATPVHIPELTAVPTMTPIPASSPFIILAYATEGIVASVIPYNQLTHINYCFLTPKSDGTFNPINNDWKLKQIDRKSVRVGKECRSRWSTNKDTRRERGERTQL